MDRPTIDATGALRQAIMTAHDYMCGARRDIDELFGTCRCFYKSCCIRL